MFAGSWTTFSLPKESPISASRTLAVGVLAAVAASVEDPTEEITEPATSAAAPTPATVLLGPGQRFSDSAAGSEEEKRSSGSGSPRRIGPTGRELASRALLAKNRASQERDSDSV